MPVLYEEHFLFQVPEVCVREDVDRELEKKERTNPGPAAGRRSVRAQVVQRLRIETPKFVLLVIEYS